MRAQDPEIFTTEGGEPRYFIRPYIDTFNENGEPTKRQERIYLGCVSEMSKRQATTKKNEIMARINRCQVVMQAQIPFGELLDYYLEQFARNPEKIATSTRGKYEAHIENHIRPAWNDRMLGQIRGLEIDRWLVEKGKPRVIEEGKKQRIKPGLSWNTRTDLRNLMSGIFAKAIEWGLWTGANPVASVSIGRKKTARPHRKLTTEQTRALLDALPGDVRRICETALYCTLRISEVLGLQWKHIDFAGGVVHVCQRYYRGDVDTVKTERSLRDVPMGLLAADLLALHPGAGHDNEYVFSVQTHVGREKKARVCRDDRSIGRYFLKPAAVALGVDYPGFGFHAFRREAITELAPLVGANQAQRMAGHSRADMSLHYTQSDLEAQAVGVVSFQEKIRGIKPEQDNLKSSNPAKLLDSWWARGDSNARPLPCQGAQINHLQASLLKAKDLFADDLDRKWTSRGCLDLGWTSSGPQLWPTLASRWLSRAIAWAV